MAINKEQNFFQKFLSGDRQYPIITAIAVGLYPILFYFTNNYTIVNTWGHLGYFIGMFIGIPIVLFVTVNYIFKISFLKKFKKYSLPFLNVFGFMFLMTICYYAGIHEKWVILSFFIALGFALLLNKFLNKVVVIQLLLAIIALFSLTPKVVKLINYSSEWKELPDDIINVKFKSHPNIYFIQPDGYVNFSELKGGVYHIDFSEMDTYLKNHKFNYYDGFRSNYSSTLSSNSATFNMKHHYYNDVTELNEMMNARKNIIYENAVLSILKQNGYKTHLITELPYLLLNKTEVGFDTCNFSQDDIPYIGNGLGEPVDFLEPLALNLAEKTDQPKFFFIEIFNPGHIAGSKRYAKGKEIERELWKENLKTADYKIIKLVDFIEKNDPNALIIIMADHGGFVGLDNTGQSFTKMQDRDLIYSIFSSTLAIKWTQGNVNEYNDLLKTNVNVFRVVFSYLSNNKKYLNSLQEDESYMIIKNGAPRGVYQYINGNGEITFKKR